jgi:hypothetical protein
MKYILAVLKTTPQRWIKMAQEIPTELFHRAPAPGEWSAHECLQHIVDTERVVFPPRVGYLLQGEDFPAFNPDDVENKPINGIPSAELAIEYDKLRSRSIELLETLKIEDLDKTARHQELGIVSLREMINEWAGHDLMHTVQAERALMQIFIDQCGPWRKYFKDHIFKTNPGDSPRPN